MGRKKKESHGFMDKNATKTGVLQIRLNHAERVDIERLVHKLNVSRAEVIRQAVERYYTEVFNDEKQ